jgi:hypothetical protein
VCSFVPSIIHPHYSRRARVGSSVLLYSRVIFLYKFFHLLACLFAMFSLGYAVLAPSGGRGIISQMNETL